MQKATGKVPLELASQPEMPEALAYLWNWFCELRPEFTYSEIEAWARMHSRNLSRWEIDTLIVFDRMRMKP